MTDGWIVCGQTQTDAFITVRHSLSMFWLEIDEICLDVSFIRTSTLIQWIQWTFGHSFLHDYGAIVPAGGICRAENG
jgi:hypothetical protein